MVKASLTQGRLPVSQRYAIIIPRIKKPGLDAADMANKAVIDIRLRPLYARPSPLATDRPHSLRSEFSGFVFALGWHTETSSETPRLVHSVIRKVGLR